VKHERTCDLCLSYMILKDIPGWLKCPSCGFHKKEELSMITMRELLMGRAKFEDLPEEIQKNGQVLLERLNKFRAEYGKPMYVSSGYRPPAANAAAGGAIGSAHLTLQACDFRDADGKLFEFIKSDPTILDRCDLYMEDARWSPVWIHMQVRPASKRIFIPSNTPPKDPSRKI